MNRNLFITHCFVVSTLLLAACNSSGKADKTPRAYVTIDAQDVKLDQSASLSLSTFVDRIDIIPLEFNDDCILKEIKKIEIHGNNIFLIEQNFDGSVYRFDREGNYLNKIGIKGQGPENTVELSDFCLNKKDNTIYILDNARQSILHYDFNGRFIERVPINQYANQLAFSEDLFYVFKDCPYNENSYSLSICDKQGVLQKVYFPPTEYEKRICALTQTFNNQGDELLFYRYMNDTVYSLKGDVLDFAYYIDFGNLKFTPEEVKDIYTDKISTLQLLLDKERVSGVDNLYKINKTLFFTTVYKIMKYLIVCDLNTGDIEISSNLWDDLEYMFYSNQFYGQTSDALIGLYDASSLDGDIERFGRYEKEGYISPEVKERQQQKMKAIGRGDNQDEMNPWVLLYQIKTN